MAANVESRNLASRIEVAVLDDAAGFDRLRGDWNRLVDEMEPPSPMLSWEWSRHWWNRFGRGGRLCILTFSTEGRVVGIAPFYERRIGIGGLALRMLKPIGWEDYGNQGLTESLELLFPSDRKADLMAELAAWLRSARVASVWLPSIGATERLPEWLAERVVETTPAVEFHHRSLPSDYLDFVQKLNKSMRSNARFYPKRLLRLGHRFELAIAESPDDVSRALPQMIRLHQTRAQAVGISRVLHWDHFYREDRAAFLQEVAPRLAEKGEFNVGLLSLDGDVVAGQMWMERANTIFLYYSGFVAQWAPYGVQLVTTLEVLKHGIERGARKVEFLRGGGQVKERWDTEVRRATSVRCALNPLANAIPAASRARQFLRGLGRP